MITAQQLTKHYGDQAALDQVSFTIQAGEAVALWGANGAGKTTALCCLLGTIAFEGQLTVNGLDVQREAKAVRAAIGYVPQEAIFHDLTVEETLQFYARLKKAPLKRAAEVLDRVQLLGQDDKRVSALSGGMKQRLALAIALLADPPIMILDEPTANLDAQAQSDFIHMIRELNQAGKTVVFSSHRLDEVSALAHRVLVLQAGQLAFESSPAELAGQLGLRQWMRIRVAHSSHATALALLHAQGYAPNPNSTAIYVHLNGAGKMAPLRALEDAEIPIEDFELTDSGPLAAQDGSK